ncbi:MAG TPA: nucleotide pyrophosphohydrolase [Alicycliphilus sp.]|nr:nucleotide pyrophosphohydrolase [Alicycliphilus sp.]
MDVKAWQHRLRDFATARDWQPYHSPKNLAMAMVVEAAELLELFQWLTPEQSHALTQEAADKERVGEELADVLLYLLQLADRTGVDLDQALEAKFAKNALKYPARRS